MGGYADRFAKRKAQRVVRHWIYVPEDLGGHPAVVFEAGRRVGDVILGLDDRLAGIARFQFRQVRRFLANVLSQPKKDAAAILRSRLRPSSGIKRSSCRGDGAIHILFIRLRDFGHNFFRRRIYHREVFLAGALYKFPVDIHPISANGGLCLACHDLLLRQL